jgi:hypothetical protein
MIINNLCIQCTFPKLPVKNMGNLKFVHGWKYTCSKNYVIMRSLFNHHVLLLVEIIHNNR